MLLGRHRSSICREVAANGGSDGYRSVDAEARACRLAARPKATKLESHPVLAATVTNWMQDQQWSPEQISGRLIEEFPDDETMRVAKETIYQELFVYGRGGLKKELVKHLRTRRPSSTLTLGNLAEQGVKSDPRQGDDRWIDPSRSTTVRSLVIGKAI